MQSPSARALGVLAVLLLGVAAALVRCGDNTPPTPPAAAAPSTPVESGTVAAQAKKAAATLEEMRQDRDREAHELLKSFRSRVFDPRRDGLVDHVEGTVDVRVQGRDAKYRFVYDAAHPEEKPVTVETVEAAAGLDSGVFRQIQQWATLACCGPFGFVAYQTPPTPLELTPSEDPKSPNLVIYVKPFKTPVSVSYSVDPRQLVQIRGEWTDQANKVVTNYEWELWHGRWLLRRAIVFQGSTTEFEYDDRGGHPMLARAMLREGDRSFEADFTYRNVRRRAK
jgi:hypothetical protein